MSDDVGFVCPHCTTKIKYTAGMTFGEVMSLRHDKEHLSHKITCLRADLAAERDRNGIITQAAQELTNALRAENERLREALKPFSDAASTDDYIDDVEVAETDTARKITFGDLRRARAAIEGVTKPSTGAENE